MGEGLLVREPEFSLSSFCFFGLGLALIWGMTLEPLRHVDQTDESRELIIFESAKVPIK